MVLTLLQGRGIYAAESGTSGEGENAFTWTLDDEGTLTISGSGSIDLEYDYEKYKHVSPWNKDDVKKVIIEKGIQSIGNSAFEDCSSLTIRCYEGSAGEKYAKENKIPYELIIRDSEDMVEVGTSDERLVVANGQDAVNTAIANNEAQKKAVEKLFGSSMTQEEKTYVFPDPLKVRWNLGEH